MAPSRSVCDDYFSSYDFFNLFLFFRIFHVFHYQGQYLSIDKILHFREKCKKCEKIKKDSKNHNSKTIDRTEFCLAPSEREKLALSDLLISCVLAFGPNDATHEINS